MRFNPDRIRDDKVVGYAVGSTLATCLYGLEALHVVRNVQPNAEEIAKVWSEVRCFFGSFGEWDALAYAGWVGAAWVVLVWLLLGGWSRTTIGFQPGLGGIAVGVVCCIVDALWGVIREVCALLLNPGRDVVIWCSPLGTVNGAGGGLGFELVLHVLFRLCYVWCGIGWLL